MTLSMLLLIFTFKDTSLAQNLISSADTQNNVGPGRVHGACFFQLQGPLTLGGARATLDEGLTQDFSPTDPHPPIRPGNGLGQHQVSRGVVVGIVKGKSRVEAFLYPDVHPLYTIFSTRRGSPFGSRPNPCANSIPLQKPPICQNSTLHCHFKPMMQF